MFWMNKEVREDLQERFQEDYPKVKWVLTFYPIGFLILAFSSLFQSILTTHLLRITDRYHEIVILLMGVNMIALLFAIVIMILYGIKEQDHKISSRIRKSLYMKRTAYVRIIAIIILLFSLSLFTHYLVPEFLKWYSHLERLGHFPFPHFSH